MKLISLSNVEIAVVNLQNIKKKLFFEYHDYLDVFDWVQINQLFLHRDSDHKIEFLNNVKFSQNRAYRMFSYKLEKIKKYFIENLFKNFITLNKILYFSSMLFAMKINENLRFCVNYQKFNVIIKWNRYFLFLIKEIIHRQNCKVTQIDLKRSKSLNRDWIIEFMFSLIIRSWVVQSHQNFP